MSQSDTSAHADWSESFVQQTRLFETVRAMVPGSSSLEYAAQDLVIASTRLLGWAQAGIPWRLAPGLTAVVVVSLLWPPQTKRNVYCHQICPHGAAQHLVRGRFIKPFSLGHRAHRLLSIVPETLLVTLIGMAVFVRGTNLAAGEPFDAFLWPIAGLSSLVIAVISLIVSAFVPMAYCRYGCPTGRLLEHLRRNAGSHHWRGGDWAAVGVCGVIWTLVLCK